MEVNGSTLLGRERITFVYTSNDEVVTIRTAETPLLRPPEALRDGYFASHVCARLGSGLRGLFYNIKVTRVAHSTYRLSIYLKYFIYSCANVPRCFFSFYFILFRGGSRRWIYAAHASTICPNRIRVLHVLCGRLFFIDVMNWRDGAEVIRMPFLISKLEE